MKKALKISLYSILGALIILAALYSLYRNEYSADTVPSSVEICDNKIDDDGDLSIDEGCWDPGNSYSIKGATFNVSTTQELARAGQLAQPGDGILINSGTDAKNPTIYTDDLVMANAGTMEKPIIIKGVGASKPIIKKQLKNSGRVEPKSFTIIENIKTDGADLTTHGAGGYGIYLRHENNVRNVLVKGCEMQHHEKGIRAEGAMTVNGEVAERLIVRNSTINKSEWGVYVGTDNDDPDINGGKAFEFKNTLWENVEVADSVYAYKNTDGFLVEGNSYHTFRNCTAHGWHDAGFDLKGHVTVDNAISYNNSYTENGKEYGIGIKVWRDGLVRDSIAYDNRVSNYLFGGYEPGWKLIGSISYNGNVSFEKRTGQSANDLSARSITLSHNMFVNSTINDEILNETGISAFKYGDHNLFSGGDIPADRGADAKVADPKFANVQSKDFHLMEGSPAIDTGGGALAAFMPKADFDGYNRKYGDAIDIGPYEFGSTTRPPDDEEDNPDYRDDDPPIDQTNKPPFFTSSRIASVTGGNLLQFNVIATDPENKAVTYAATSLPSGATFSGRTFSWKPSLDQAGSYFPRIVARDSGGNTATQYLAIRVIKPVTTIEKRQINVSSSGSTLNFQVCRNPLYTNRYTEIFRFGDGSNGLVINKPGRSRCSNFYSHTYSKAGQYQLVLHLCERDSRGKLKCFPNVVKNFMF